MLSTKYHITYWAAAIGAVTIYRFLALYPPCVTAFRLAIGPLAAYTTYASLIWHRNGNKRTELTIYTHQAMVAYLLVALGSVANYFQLPNPEVPKPTALIHVLSAFMTVGVLESFRQNRRDIEPASFRIIHLGPRTQLKHWSWCCVAADLGSTFVCDAILFAVLLATDRMLCHVGGMSLRHIVPYWGWEKMQYPGRLGSAIVAHYLGGPFADMAETIYYALCRHFVPHLTGPRGWTPELVPLLIPVSPFFSLPSAYTEVIEYALFWLPRMILPRDQYDYSTLLGEPRRDILSRLFGVLGGF